MRLKAIKSSRGFTIVELMIALSVLSTILVLATVIMINIGSLYSKGVNLSNLQNTNRNILSGVSSSFQFTGQNLQKPLPNPNTDDVYAACIGTTRYSYVLNKELGNDIAGPPTAHVLWRDTMKSSATCTALNLTVGNPTASAADSIEGSEMVGAHMRLIKFNIAGTDPYDIDVWLAYGDSDLLCDTGDPGNCDPGQVLKVTANPDRVLCKGGAGQTSMS